MSHSISLEVFEARLRHHFGMEPTEGQQRLFHVFTRFAFSEKPRCGLVVKGYAGTGKTSAVKAMVKALTELGVGIVLLAPTGRAAKVLSSYSGLPASTIHRQIYSRKGDRSGRVWFELRESGLKDTIFIVDEASMIGNEFQDKGGDELASSELLEDLLAHVFSGENCRVVLIGDSAQLPPVGSSLSPALDLSVLRDRYDLTVAETELTEVKRQQAESGILSNATTLREAISSGSDSTPALVVEANSEVDVIEGDVQPYVEDCLARYGRDGAIILTRSNKRANLFNQQMRLRVLGYEEEISAGDRMMVVRNNYYWLQGEAQDRAGFIANGDIIEVVRVRSFLDRGEFRFCKVVIRFADYTDLPEQEVILWCNAIYAEGPGLPFSTMKALAEEIAADYEDIDSAVQRRKAIKEDPYYNALQVRFAYAVTVHKAQGGQWPCIIIDRGYIGEDTDIRDYNRWLYTALTRAQEKVWLAGFPPEAIASPQRHP